MLKNWSMGVKFEKLIKPLLSSIVIVVFYNSYGQGKFELVQADKTGEGIYNKKKVKKYYGNVEFIKNEVYLYCDSAYVYESENNLEAFGNIRVIKADAYTLSGDRLSYFENKNKVVMRGNVLVRRKRDKRKENLKFKLK